MLIRALNVWSDAIGYENTGARAPWAENFWAENFWKAPRDGSRNDPLRDIRIVRTGIVPPRGGGGWPDSGAG